MFYFWTLPTRSKIVGLIMSAVISTDAEKLIAIHVASIADAVNALDGIG